ncbi:hypothetical protein BH11PSE9_BH11PSE9_09040 [soil metagenome]
MTAAMQQHRESTFAISPLVKLECLVAPMKRGDPVLQRNFEAMFRQFVSVDLPEVVYLQAAALRARFALKTPDALHLACAQHHGCDALWTNDERLAKAAHGMSRNVLQG